MTRKVVVGIIVGVVFITATIFLTNAINQKIFRKQVESKEVVIQAQKSQISWLQTREGIDSAEQVLFLQWILTQSYLDTLPTGQASTYWGKIAWLFQKIDDQVIIYLSHPINTYSNVEYDILRNHPWGILKFWIKKDATINDVFTNLIERGIFKEVLSSDSNFDYSKVNKE